MFHHQNRIENSLRARHEALLPQKVRKRDNWGGRSVPEQSRENFFSRIIEGAVFLKALLLGN